MSKDNKKEGTPRHLLVPLLAKKFTAEYRDAIRHYETEQQLELTEHLLKVLEFLKQCTSSDEKTAYPDLVESIGVEPTTSFPNAFGTGKLLSKWADQSFDIFPALFSFDFHFPFMGFFPTAKCFCIF